MRMKNSASLEKNRLTEGDTLVNISYPPNIRLVDSSGLEIKDFETHRVHSAKLVRTGSRKFSSKDPVTGSLIPGGLLDPLPQGRLKRRFGYVNGRPLPPGITYLLDLTPPESDEDAIDLVASLSCSTGIRNWYTSHERCGIPKKYVGGWDETTLSKSEATGTMVWSNLSPHPNLPNFEHCEPQDITQSSSSSTPDSFLVDSLSINSKVEEFRYGEPEIGDYAHHVATRNFLSRGTDPWGENGNNQFVDEKWDSNTINNTSHKEVEYRMMRAEGEGDRKTYLQASETNSTKRFVPGKVHTRLDDMSKTYESDEIIRPGPVTVTLADAQKRVDEKGDHYNTLVTATLDDAQNRVIESEDQYKAFRRAYDLSENVHNVLHTSKYDSNKEIDIRNVEEYSPIRHRAGIIKLLQCIEGKDPGLDSAPKVWTLAVIAKYFDCISAVVSICPSHS
jgi:hypothetical protein